MTRKEVYVLIETERTNQEKLWPRDDNNSLSQQYNWWAPHFLVLEEKVSRIRGMWYESKRELLANEFVKVAAIATRALEEVGDLKLTVEKESNE